MNIVITGESSLLALNIASYFSNKSYNVTLIGRGKESLNSFSNCKYIKVNWDNLDEFFAINRKIDLLIHCAGMNSINCEKNSAEAFWFNTYITARLTEICSINNVINFIYLSTVHIYSATPSGLITEELLPTNNHPYARSKLSAEQLIAAIGKKRKMKYLILRLSNVIASPTSKHINCWSLLPQNICMNLAKSKKIILNSDPNNKRDFIAMTQLNKFLEYYLNNNNLFNSGVYNFTSARTLTIYEFAKILQKLYTQIYKERTEIHFKNQSKVNVSQSYCYSNEKIQNSGFKIDIEIQEDLKSLLTFTESIFRNKTN